MLGSGNRRAPWCREEAACLPPVPASNPLDPSTPPEQQQTASLRGRIALAAPGSVACQPRPDGLPFMVNGVRADARRLRLSSDRGSVLFT